jgi:hypothetical protein
MKVIQIKVQKMQCSRSIVLFTSKRLTRIFGVRSTFGSRKENLVLTDRNQDEYGENCLMTDLKIGTFLLV